MTNTNIKPMREQERLKKLYSLRDMCKLHLLGQDDVEYRSEIEHWIRIVTEEISISMEKIELNAV